MKLTVFLPVFDGSPLSTSHIFSALSDQEPIEWSDGKNRWL
jgi:hypothetical protein